MKLQKKNNENGYVMVWVLIMALAIMVFMVAAMELASSYYRRSNREYLNRQVHFTAASIAQIAVAEFTEDQEGVLRLAVMEELKPYIEEEPLSEEVAVTPIVWKLDSSMGTCTMTGIYDTDTKQLILTAEAEMGPSKESISVVLEIDELAEDSSWTLVRYEPGN